MTVARNERAPLARRHPAGEKTSRRIGLIEEGWVEVLQYPTIWGSRRGPHMGAPLLQPISAPRLVAAHTLRYMLPSRRQHAWVQGRGLLAPARH